MARARAIQNGPLSKISGVDNANAKTGCSEGDGDEMHFSEELSRLGGEYVKALKMLNVVGFILDLYVEDCGETLECESYSISQRLANKLMIVH